MPIKSHTDKMKQLTIFTGIGEISYEEVRTAIDSFYEGSHTLTVLWDLRNAIADSISSEQVGQIADLIKQYDGVRKGIRTAIVTPKDITYGLSRMLISLLETKEAEFPVNMMVFRTIAEAMNWLSEND